MQLQLDGRITGESVTEAAGPYATILRQLGAQVMAQGSERAATDRLRLSTIRDRGTSARSHWIRWSHDIGCPHTSRWMPGLACWKGTGSGATGMRLLSRPGDGLLGPLAMPTLPAGEPTPCWAGRQEEELLLALPAGYRPVRLPRPRLIETAWFTYQSRWSLDDGVRRKAEAWYPAWTSRCAQDRSAPPRRKRSMRSGGTTPYRLNWRRTVDSGILDRLLAAWRVRTKRLSWQCLNHVCPGMALPETTGATPCRR